MKKFLAIFIAVIMLFSMCAIAVSAEDETVEYTQQVTFNSVMNLGSDAISGPNATYTYTLTAGAATTYVAYADTESEITEESEKTTTNVAAGVMPTEGTVQTAEFTVNDYADSKCQIVKSVTFDFSTADYTEPGLYSYVVTETSEDDEAYVNDTYATIIVIVKIIDGEYVATEFMMFDGSYSSFNNTQDKSAGFYNGYGSGSLAAGFTSSNFVITDTALGDMASKSKDFLFTTVTSDVATGTVFKVKNADGTIEYIIQTADGLMYADYSSTEGTYTSNDNAFTFELHDGEEYIIYAVTEGMSFTVTIEDESYDGYSFYARGYGLTALIDGSDAYFTDQYYINEFTALGYEQGVDFELVYDEDTNEFIGVSPVDGGAFGSSGESIMADIEGLDTNATATWSATLNQVEGAVADGEYHEGYINSWNELSSYTVTVTAFNVLQLGDTSDLENMETFDVGIDFATVKGEELGEEPDDVGITYDEELPTTGIILEIAPYALMVLLAAAFVVLRAMSARKKQWA